MLCLALLWCETLGPGIHVDVTWTLSVYIIVIISTYVPISLSLLLPF